MSKTSQKFCYEEIQEAASYIRGKLRVKNEGAIAKVGVVLGSGLGSFADEVIKTSKSLVIDYADIPHFPTSSIEGHNSRLIFGYIDKKPVLIMQGRVHRYEGYTAQQVVFPVRVLHALGIQQLILTNASGGMADGLNPGDLMVIKDHVNLTGDNPLIGPNDLRLGARFFDMSDAYDKKLRRLAKETGFEQSIILKEGVYAGVLGPSYETPAEIKMFKAFGADAVGMSTVFETIAGKHMNMNILGIACITNKAAGLSHKPLSHDEVTETSRKIADRFATLLFAIITKLQ